MNAVLIRGYLPEQTLGKLSIYNEDIKLLECVTLEPQNNGNKKKISCIPESNYIVKKHISPTFGNCFKVQNVKDRTDILIHAGNYRKDTLGCILVGSEYSDINSDGVLDIINSKRTLTKLLKLLPEEFILKIQSCQTV